MYLYHYHMITLLICELILKKNTTGLKSSKACPIFMLFKVDLGNEVLSTKTHTPHRFFVFRKSDEPNSEKANFFEFTCLTFLMKL